MIKIFEDFNERNVAIDDICKKYKIENYTINPDGTIDVDGDVNLKFNNLFNLPLKFGKVSGHFDCSMNSLISLEGSPNYVGGTYDCYQNQLRSLKGSPTKIDGHLVITKNNLKTLKWATTKVRGLYFLNLNPLPDILYKNIDHIEYIIANQDDYGIWREDGSFNELRFEMMMKENDNN